MPTPEAEGWSEYRRLVLQELERLSAQIEGLRKEQVETRGAVIALQVKASIWGGVAGTIGGALAWLLTRK